MTKKTEAPTGLGPSADDIERWKREFAKNRTTDKANAKEHSWPSTPEQAHSQFRLIFKSKTPLLPASRNKWQNRCDLCGTLLRPGAGWLLGPRPWKFFCQVHFEEIELRKRSDEPPFELLDYSREAQDEERNDTDTCQCKCGYSGTILTFHLDDPRYFLCPSCGEKQRLLKVTWQATPIP